MPSTAVSREVIYSVSKATDYRTASRAEPDLRDTKREILRNCSDELRHDTKTGGLYNHIYYSEEVIRNDDEGEIVEVTQTIPDGTRASCYTNSARAWGMTG